MISVIVIFSLSAEVGVAGGMISSCSYFSLNESIGCSIKCGYAVLTAFKPPRMYFTLLPNLLFFKNNTLNNLHFFF